MRKPGKALRRACRATSASGSAPVLASGILSRFEVGAQGNLVLLSFRQSLEARAASDARPRRPVQGRLRRSPIANADLGPLPLGGLWRDTRQRRSLSPFIRHADRFAVIPCPTQFV